jgi:hypothetical protein
MDEVRADDVLLTFDGQVLELFGYIAVVTTIHSSSNLRFHVHNLRIEVQSPDRKGRRDVRFALTSTSGVSCQLRVEEAEWATVEPFLQRVAAAIPAA